MTSLAGKNLTCVRGESSVFENLSFEINGGQILALAGKNGSGKTSLLRLLAGLIEPAGGTLAWNGEQAMMRDLAGAFHWIGTEAPFKPLLTVAENLSFWAAAMDAPAANTNTALAKLDMEALADASVQHLSTGQIKRASLCRLFLAPRPLWLLDEPETGLDTAALAKLYGHLRGHTSSGGMAVIATHRPDLWHPDSILTLEDAA